MLIPADLRARAARLDALALLDEDDGDHELAASRRHRALIDRRAAAKLLLAPPAPLCRCGVAVPRSALDRVLFRFLLLGGAWTCPDCRDARAHQTEASPC